MESLTIHEYATDENFVEAHSQHGVSETDQPLVWALLTELDPEAVFVRLPRWLASPTFQSNIWDHKRTSRAS
jgi:hypothetical protein